MFLRVSPILEQSVVKTIVITSSASGFGLELGEQISAPCPAFLGARHI